MLSCSCKFRTTRRPIVSYACQTQCASDAAELEAPEGCGQAIPCCGRAVPGWSARTQLGRPRLFSTNPGYVHKPVLMAAPLGLVGALLVAAKVARDVSRKRKQEQIMEEVGYGYRRPNFRFGTTDVQVYCYFRSLQYRKGLAVPLEQAMQVRDGMITQMEVGLRETSSKEGLLMLPSYIDILPTG